MTPPPQPPSGTPSPFGFALVDPAAGYGPVAHEAKGLGGICRRRIRWIPSPADACVERAAGVAYCERGADGLTEKRYRLVEPSGASLALLTLGLVPSVAAGPEWRAGHTDEPQAGALAEAFAPMLQLRVDPAALQIRYQPAAALLTRRTVESFAALAREANRDMGRPIVSDSAAELARVELAIGLVFEALVAQERPLLPVPGSFHHDLTIRLPLHPGPDGLLTVAPDGLIVSRPCILATRTGVRLDLPILAPAGTGPLPRLAAGMQGAQVAQGPYTLLEEPRAAAGLAGDVVTARYVLDGRRLVFRAADRGVRFDDFTIGLQVDSTGAVQGLFLEVANLPLATLHRLAGLVGLPVDTADDGTAMVRLALTRPALDRVQQAYTTSQSLSAFFDVRDEQGRPVLFDLAHYRLDGILTCT